MFDCPGSNPCATTRERSISRSSTCTPAEVVALNPPPAGEYASSAFRFQFPWLRPPPARRQDAHETRDIGDGIGDTGAVVVVVREALVGLISGEGGAQAELEPVGERLVDVGPYVLAVVERVVDDPAVVLCAGCQEVPRVLRAPAHVDVGLVGERFVPRDLLQVVVGGQLAVYLVSLNEIGRASCRERV